MKPPSLSTIFFAILTMTFVAPKINHPTNDPAIVNPNDKRGLGRLSPRKGRLGFSPARHRLEAYAMLHSLRECGAISRIASCREFRTPTATTRRCSVAQASSLCRGFATVNTLEIIGVVARLAAAEEKSLLEITTSGPAFLL
jgi:hypothetical protein